MLIDDNMLLHTVLPLEVSVTAGLFLQDSTEEQSEPQFHMMLLLKCIQVQSSLCLTVNVCQIFFCTAASEEIIQILDNIKVDCPGNGTNKVHGNSTFVLGGIELVVMTDLVQKL